MSFKKFTAALSTLAIVMTSVFTFGVVASAATTFTDASKIASWASASVSSLVDAGVIAGRSDGSFDPQGNLNRAEMAKIATLGAGLAIDTTGAPHFNDVAASDWFYSFVETLYNNGVVGGVNGGALDSNGLATYNPAGTLNRAEAAKILVDAFDLETAYAGTPANFPDVTKGAWFFDYVETAYAHGLLNGYSNGNFGPSDAVTREQVAVIAQASREEAGLVSGVTAGSKRRTGYTAGAASTVATDTTTPTTPTTSDGTLNVALSASTAAAQTFPKGASSTAVAAYNFTASSAGSVTISNLTIKRTGVGTDGDWTLYLYDGANRLTSGKTINSTSHEATFSGLSISVAAGTTKTITVKADTSTSSTGGDSYFEINSASSVTSNAAGVTGSFPVKSNKQEVNTSVTAGSITIAKNGSVTNPKVGEDDVVIAKFKLTTANEAGLVSQVALIVDGTISATDVQNARLYQGTTLLATAAAVNSKDLLVFNLATPYSIEKGDSRNFEVKADLNTGRGGDTLKVYLDEGTDLVATGGTYGFGMSVTYGDYDNVTSGGTDDSESTLQGGDITLSSSGPAAADVAVNAKDVVLMNFNITSVSEVTFKKFGLGLISDDADSASDAGGLLDGTTSNYTDIKIINKDTGAIVMGPIDANVMKDASAGTTAITATTDGDGYYTFSDEFTMTAGQSLNLSVTADIANNTGADFIDDAVYAQIDISDSTLEIKDVNNKAITNSASVVPTSDINGKSMSIKSASLTVTKSSTPVSDTAVKGSQDVNLLGVTLAAGASSDSKITEMLFRVRADDDTTFLADQLSANDYVSNLELWIDGVKVAGPEGLTLVGASATGYYKATFDNMSYVVPAGSTVQAILKGDLSTNVSATTYIGASIDPNDDITAEDEDGNTITAGGTSELNGAATQLPLLTVSTGGSLTVAVDPDTAKENIVVAGTSDVAMSKFKFTSTDEAFVIKKLSINNLQAGITSGDLGEYDNNIVSVKLSYTNSAGATETKTGYLTAGTANFSGMDMYVAKDSDALLTVTATLNTIAAGATAAELVALNVAFNDFEAVASGSGETYKVSKLDNDVSATSDLDLGAYTWTTTGTTTSSTSVSVAGSSQTLTLASGVYLPVGTLLMTGTDTTFTAATDELFVVTSTLEGTSATVTVVDDGGAVAGTPGTLAGTETVYYALPGTGVLTATNKMAVYETKPTITLATTSPSGSRTTAASDGIFKFTIAADAMEKVIINTITVDLSSDASMDSTQDAITAYLKEGGSTVASVTVTTTTASAATMTFTPTTALEIAKGTSKTFTVELDTTTLMTNQAGVDDLLTPSIDLGSSTDGSVSAGDVSWNDTNATVTWFGQVENSTLNGNTLKY